MIPSANRFITAFDPFGPELHSAAQHALATPDARAQALSRLIERLPNVHPEDRDLNRDWVTIGRPADLTAAQLDQLDEVLKGLKPWRKGPFNLFGIRIDSEWNAALKWDRIVPYLAPLKGRKVLDVGSSNGYYLFRMAAAHPCLLLGIEPYAVYYYQFLALQRYLALPDTYCLPLRLEALPDMPHWFDTIFCMGMLYHRRSPLDCLLRMKTMLSTGGQLILETLIIPGEDDMALFPQGRYARMRNVFFIPTVKCLLSWLERCGFYRTRCVDITPTTIREQRKTQWLDSESLEACIDPRNRHRTVEGYPAPIRAVVIAERK
jgi:tRNA (mo5U34)-methyltransferase